MLMKHFAASVSFGFSACTAFKRKYVSKHKLFLQSAQTPKVADLLVHVSLCLIRVTAMDEGSWVRPAQLADFSLSHPVCLHHAEPEQPAVSTPGMEDGPCPHSLQRSF